MKFMKWKILLITCGVCLFPILWGVALWEQLPDVMAIHFNLANQPDRYASKGVVVFVLPILMVLLQLFCCFINDINAYRYGERKKFSRATKWIIPVMTLLLQALTLGYGLGWKADIRRVAMLISGGVLLVVGNYLPKFDYIRSKTEVETAKARKINRFIGFETVILGVLFWGSVLFPPEVSAACLFLLIPYALIASVYSTYVLRKNA